MPGNKKGYKMKPKHIFWGLLFVSLGILILINNISGIYWNWLGLWKLWPLLLILWGIGIMIKNNTAKIVIAGVAGIVLAISLFASFNAIVHLTNSNFDFVFDNKSDYKYEFTEYNEPFTNNIKSASFYFKAGAGSFISGNDTTANLFTAHTEGLKNNYELSKIINGTDAVIKMDMKKNHIHIGKDGIRNRVEMKFSKLPDWNLNFEVGAASLDLDLTPVKVKTLNIDMGAASLKVKLGYILNRTDVDIHSGASNVEIEVPKDAGCEIKSEGALNSNNFPGFYKAGTDLYRSEKFDSTSKKIYINLDAGVSSLNVNRYSGDW